MPPWVGASSLSKPANTAMWLAALGGAVEPNTVCVPGISVSVLLAINTSGKVPAAGARAPPAYGIGASIRVR